MALSLVVVAPAFATPSGAAAGRVEQTGQRRPRYVSEKVRTARIIAEMRRRGLTPEARDAKLRAAGIAAGTLRGRWIAAPRRNAQRQLTVAQRRALVRRQAAQKAARQKAARQKAARQKAARQKAAAVAASQAAAASSPSVPVLVSFGLLPFVLMGLYLLGADYLRRRGERPPRKRRRRRGPSLVITRVGDR